MSITLCYLCARQFLLNIIYLSKFNDTKKKKKKHKHKNDDITRTLQNACRTHIHVYTKRQKKKTAHTHCEKNNNKKIEEKKSMWRSKWWKKKLGWLLFFSFQIQHQEWRSVEKKNAISNGWNKNHCKAQCNLKNEEKKNCDSTVLISFVCFFFKRNRIRTCFMSIFIPWTNAVIIDIYGILNEKLYK